MTAFLLPGCVCGGEICGWEAGPARFEWNPEVSPLLLVLCLAIWLLLTPLYFIQLNVFNSIHKARDTLIAAQGCSGWPSQSWWLVWWWRLQSCLSPVSNAQKALHVLPTSILKMLSTAISPFPEDPEILCMCSSLWKIQAWCYSWSPFMRWMTLGTQWELNRASTQQPAFTVHVFLQRYKNM